MLAVNHLTSIPLQVKRLVVTQSRRVPHTPPPRWPQEVVRITRRAPPLTPPNPFTKRRSTENQRSTLFHTMTKTNTEHFSFSLEEARTGFLRGSGNLGDERVDQRLPLTSVLHLPQALSAWVRAHRVRSVVSDRPL